MPPSALAEVDPEPKSWSHEALGCRHLILKMVALYPGSLNHPQVTGPRYTLWLGAQRALSFPVVPRRSNYVLEPEFRSSCICGDRTLWLCVCEDSQVGETI